MQILRKEEAAARLESERGEGSRRAELRAAPTGMFHCGEWSDGHAPGEPPGLTPGQTPGQTPGEAADR